MSQTLKTGFSCDEAHVVFQRCICTGSQTPLGLILRKPSSVCGWSGFEPAQITAKFNVYSINCCNVYVNQALGKGDHGDANFKYT